MKTRIKGFFIGAYCAGWLLAFAVVVAFVVLKLKAE